jgi:hypothetical protein
VSRAEIAWFVMAVMGVRGMISGRMMYRNYFTPMQPRKKERLFGETNPRHGGVVRGT